MGEVKSVATFKTFCKQVISECSFREGVQDVMDLYDRDMFSELKLRDETTMVHWWTKVVYRSGDLRKMTSRCLLKVNTMVNTIITSSYKKYETSDGLTEVQVDECLAELLYLKRAIDTQI